jgi:hypothetical protein
MAYEVFICCYFDQEYHDCVGVHILLTMSFCSGFSRNSLREVSGIHEFNSSDLFHLNFPQSLRPNYDLLPGSEPSMMHSPQFPLNEHFKQLQILNQFMAMIG